MIRWIKAGWFRAMTMAWSAPFLITASVAGVFGSLAERCLARIMKYERRLSTIRSEGSSGA